MSNKSGKKNIDLPIHRHCAVCGKNTDMSKQFCSTECEMKYAQAMRKNKRSQTITFVLLIVVIVAFTVLPMLGNIF